MNYAIENLPLKDELLKNAQFLNFFPETCQLLVKLNILYKGRLVNWNSSIVILLLVNRFKDLLPYESSQQLELLSEEFTTFQLLEEHHIPEVRKAATITEDDEKDTKYYRMDYLWQFLSSVKDGDGSLKFPNLAKVAKVVLVIPHSNAQEERVFSMIRKIRAFRPSLDPK